MSKQKSHWLGCQAENYALDYLKYQGLILVERNFRCKQGEIDLIMHDKHRLIFIEVRYRTSSCHGTAVESVTWLKQQRILKTARFYLNFHFKARSSIIRLPEQPVCRFDVVGVSLDRHTPSEVYCTWVKQAFIHHN